MCSAAHEKLLSQLIASLPESQLVLEHDVRITGLALNSRQVQPGSLFVALSGGTTDGHRYIPDALRRGASAVVGSQAIPDLSVPYLQVQDGRLALALLSAAFYDHPANQLVVIGVTGTDGKTTTANLLFHILQAASIRAGMISTVNAVIGDQTLDTGFHVTTPEAPEVQSYLQRMLVAGLTHVILEATSHGLAQHRVAACEFDMAFVTNITHEHLDFHGSYEAYREAKGRLFTSLAHTPTKASQPPRAAVLNRDDQSFDYLSGITSVSQISYGLSGQADIQAADIVAQPDGLRFEASGRDLSGAAFRLPVVSPLVGAYNVSNCLAAIALVRGVMALEDGAVLAGLATMQPVPGRMERIEMGQDFTAMVDFAHTPNALRRQLEAIRPLTSGHVIAVFGAAGLRERDRQKRRMMAETSAELADLTILTAEDPRTESLDAILAEMAAGMQARGGVEGKTYWRVADRGDAIRFAVQLAQPGDSLVACGKGHEQSMCFGETEYPWDDRVAMRAALAERLGISGPEMPYLPTQEE